VAFKVNPVSLQEILRDCQSGALQLPDFQRSWVWDEERIIGLIASISKGFPIGAVMTLETGGEVRFKPRPIEGVVNPPKAAATLLLDGQQRLTSLYQVMLRNEVVRTTTPKNKIVRRWFYIDMRRAIDDSVDREEAIIAIPENRKIAENFGKDIVLDLSVEGTEFEHMMFPLSSTFNWTTWSHQLMQHPANKDRIADVFPIMQSFYEIIVKSFESYLLPVITLDKNTSKAAVCTVFDKVNTGGKALDAFELVTATFAADDYELRKDWYGTPTANGLQHTFSSYRTLNDESDGVLSKVQNTDFLHVISLFHTREMRRGAEAAGKSGKELPQVTGKREALLDLPLGAYLKYQDIAREGFLRAAKFLHQLHIYRTFDLPYQSQVTALAAILGDMPEILDKLAMQQKVREWYWNGVFGELYGSSIESRIARDFLQVPAWLNGGPLPMTIEESQFRPDRLLTMRMRLSAAYKGVNALLMETGARDFLSGQKFDHTVFFGESVDIHHIFPRKWCQDNGIQPAVFDSIVNKSPLSSRTNIKIGGAAPSSYLNKLDVEHGSGGADGTSVMNSILESHLINPLLLRSDRFDAFMADRQQQLLKLIADATGKQNTLAIPAPLGHLDEIGEVEEEESEAELTLIA
jgi:hypothetical protein